MWTLKFKIQPTVTFFTAGTESVCAGPLKNKRRFVFKEHDIDIRLTRTQHSAVSEHANEPTTIRSGTKLRSLTATHTSTPARLKRLTLTTSAGIMKLKFQKLGCQRSNNTTILVRESENAYGF